MGNQTTKVTSVAKNNKYGDQNDNEKKSRTNWTAGVASPPGRPVVELSSRISAPEEDSVTDEVNLTWGVPEDDGGYPITGYRVEMLDIQTGKWIEITFIEGYEPKCTLSNILYGIMYRFRVIAINDAGPSEPGDPSDPVVIDVPGVQIAPYFVQILNDTIALEHEKIEFRVRVLGTPKPSIQWYKDDTEIFSCDRIEMKEEEEGGVVILKGARLSDSGAIKCVATNILGRATSAAQLIIEAAPRFEIPESYVDGLIFRHEEIIRLKIPMIAKPTPKVVWFFEDEPITPGSDLFIETTDTYTSLRIQGAKRWHCGEFRVYAENENGEDAASILVTVTSPPSPPGRPVVIDITETRCTLRWEPSEDDGGADVKHYIVEYFRDVWDVWLKAKTTKECQVTIDDLIPGSRYKFRIKSENAYGISDPGEESDPFDVGSCEQGERQNEEGWRNSGDGINIEISEASDSPQTPIKRPQNLLGTKHAWESEEQEEDILDRFLKVKKFADNRVASYESDGLPSMSAIEEDEMMTEAADIPSHVRNARRFFAELKQFSGDSTHPDLESISGDEEPPKPPQRDRTSKEDLQRARELYAELQQMSAETGGSIENIMESISTSMESLSSIIPVEKRQELSKFEMTLKEMIEEARQMAKTPESSREDLSYFEPPQVRPSSSQQTREEFVKSPSLQSMAESVVSVIERQIPSRPGSAAGSGRMSQMSQQLPASPTARVSPQFSTPEISLTSEAGFGARVLQPKLERKTFSSQPSLSTLVGRSQAAVPGVSAAMMPEAQLQQQRQFASEKSIPATSSAAAATSRFDSPKPRGVRGQSQPEPMVGADRYEEIIVTRGRRGSSQLSLDKFNTLPGSTMAMREDRPLVLDNSSVVNKASQPVSSSGIIQNRQIVREPSAGLISSRPGSRAGSTLQLNSSIPPSKDITSQLNLEIRPIPAPAPTVVPSVAARPVVLPTPKEFVAKPIEVSINPTQPSPLSSKNDVIDSRGEIVPPKMSSFIPTKVPDWLIIMTVYSMVIISILLISNVTPNGKLYIHFTAFWSMIIYFLLDDNQSTDVIETFMEGMVRKK